jgi:hypothetical protein
VAEEVAGGQTNRDMTGSGISFTAVLFFAFRIILNHQNRLNESIDYDELGEKDRAGHLL